MYETSACAQTPGNRGEFKNEFPVSQYVWHVREPLLLKDRKTNILIIKLS